MARDDWYRGSAWDSRTRELFEGKLSRVRLHTRAEYLRIKGLELTASESESMRVAGRDLLKRVVDEHPDDELQVTLAHRELAQSVADDGSSSKLPSTTWRALAPSSPTPSSVSRNSFSKPAGSIGTTRALDMLRKDEAIHDPFPAMRFRWNLAAARLASRSDQPGDAQELAKIALRALDETESPFVQHRNRGLASADQQTIQELHRTAAGS